MVNLFCFPSFPPGLKLPKKVLKNNIPKHPHHSAMSTTINPTGGLEFMPHETSATEAADRALRALARSSRACVRWLTPP